MKTIDIYTTPQCGFCKQIKALLQQENMTYMEHDVTRSEETLTEMRAITHGALSVPVVVVDKDTEAMKYAIGFYESKKLLGLTHEKKYRASDSAEVANLTCPRCGHVQQAPIPTASCIPFYVCDGCKKTIQAEGDNCCVFCSYADKPCPISNKQAGGASSCDGNVCDLPY